MKNRYFKYTITYMVEQKEIVKVFKTVSLITFVKVLDSFQRENLDFNIKNITNIKDEIIADYPLS